MSYWDSSALVKLYLQEPNSIQFQRLAFGAGRIVTCILAQYEMWTVFRRREAEGVITPGEAARLYRDLQSDVASANVVVNTDAVAIEKEFGAVIEGCLSQVPPVFIRTSDALHLAFAKAAGETRIVTADNRQRAAATLMGFTVLPVP